MKPNEHGYKMDPMAVSIIEQGLDLCFQKVKHGHTVTHETVIAMKKADIVLLKHHAQRNMSLGRDEEYRRAFSTIAHLQRVYKL